jgi:hypothetical protein
LEASVKDRKALLKAKVDVNIENKNAFKIRKLRVVEKCGLISCVEFKAIAKFVANSCHLNHVMLGHSSVDQ